MSNDPEEASVLEVMGQEYDQPIRETEPGRDESDVAIGDDRDSDPPMPAALAQVSFRIEPALLHEFKLRARARNVTVQAAGADALSRWLRSTAPPN